jgi:hypothetical protein
MSEFVYRGHVPRTYPGHLHPEQDGVLSVDPDEVIDFGTVSPPADGQWYDNSSGQPFLGQPAPVTDVVGDDDSGEPGTGDASEQQEE